MRKSLTFQFTSKYFKWCLWNESKDPEKSLHKRVKFSFQVDDESTARRPYDFSVPNLSW